MGAKINIFPVIHKHRKNKQGLVAIALRIDRNGNPVAYDDIRKSNPFKIPLESWDESTRSVRKSYANAPMINNLIVKRQTELEGIFIIKEQMGFKLTISNIKLLVAGKDPSKCFYEFSRKQIEQKYDNKDTRRTYLGEITKLEEYRPELSFYDIDFAFLQGYASWMRDDRGNQPNTIWKTFKFMNTMMNDAIKMKIIEENPFDTYDRGQYKQTPRVWLTKTERPKVEELLTQPIPEELAKVTAYLLLMCYAGLRFEDAMAFNYDEHIIDDERLVMVTGKEDEPINIKLYPKLREVILFIKERPLQMANKPFNNLLKVVATMAGIEKKLTAHVGRHSFGRLLAETGIDKKKAQKMLGHRDERSTNIYYHLMDTDVDNEIDSKLAHL